MHGALIPGQRRWVNDSRPELQSSAASPTDTNPQSPNQAPHIFAPDFVSSTSNLGLSPAISASISSTDMAYVSKPDCSFAYEKYAPPPGCPASTETISQIQLTTSSSSSVTVPSPTTSSAPNGYASASTMQRFSDVVASMSSVASASMASASVAASTSSSSTPIPQTTAPPPSQNSLYPFPSSSSTFTTISSSTITPASPLLPVSDPGKHGMSASTKIGVSVPMGIIGVMLMSLFVFAFIRKRQRNKVESSDTANTRGNIGGANNGGVASSTVGVQSSVGGQAGTLHSEQARGKVEQNKHDSDQMSFMGCSCCPNGRHGLPQNLNEQRPPPRAYPMILDFDRRPIKHLAGLPEGPNSPPRVRKPKEMGSLSAATTTTTTDTSTEQTNSVVDPTERHSGASTVPTTSTLSTIGGISSATTLLGTPSEQTPKRLSGVDYGSPVSPTSPLLAPLPSVPEISPYNPRYRKPIPYRPTSPDTNLTEEQSTMLDSMSPMAMSPLPMPDKQYYMGSRFSVDSSLYSQDLRAPDSLLHDPRESYRRRDDQQQKIAEERAGAFDLDKARELKARRYNTPSPKQNDNLEFVQPLPPPPPIPRNDEVNKNTAGKDRDSDIDWDTDIEELQRRLDVVGHAQQQELEHAKVVIIEGHDRPIVSKGSAGNRLQHQARMFAQKIAKRKPDETKIEESSEAVSSKRESGGTSQSGASRKVTS